MSIPLPPYFNFKDWDKFSGILYRWDVDKTYLDTKFESFRQLIKIPFEKSSEKIAIKGAPALVRNIRVTAKGISPVCFITSSPTQLREAISGKLLLDKVYVDDIKFKDQIKNIKQRKFSKLTDHITYKLSRLLWGRLNFPKDTQEILFGDDSEQDAFIYNLYADLLSKKISSKDLLKILDYWDIDSEDARKLNVLFQEIIQEDLHHGGVKKIFIHLATNTEPTYYLRYGLNTIPIYNYLEVAIILFTENLLTDSEFLKIYEEQKIDIKFDQKYVTDCLNGLTQKTEYNFTQIINLLVENKIVSEIVIKPSKKKFFEAYWENNAQKYME